MVAEEQWQDHGTKSADNIIAALNNDSIQSLSNIIILQARNG